LLVSPAICHNFGRHVLAKGKSETNLLCIGLNLKQFKNFNDIILKAELLLDLTEIASLEHLGIQHIVDDVQKENSRVLDDEAHMNGFFVWYDHHEAFQHSQNCVDRCYHLVTHSGRDHLLNLFLLFAQLVAEVTGPVLEQDQPAILVFILDVNQVESDHLVFLLIEVFVDVFILLHHVVKSVSFSIDKSIAN
jgi:hypothetical protein